MEVQEQSASRMNTTLPLAWRLRRAFLIALLLGLWAPFKIVWEQDIAREQDLTRYRGAPMTRQLRDQLGQGLTIGVLSGMRSAVADLVWAKVVTAWMTQDWLNMASYINICTTLQPRSPVFWDMGGWHLAWNASIDALGDDPVRNPPTLKQIKASRFWIDRGLELYTRGIENNPTYWRLWNDKAMVYDQRLHDYKTAAYYYQKASEAPNSMTYLERFPAIMYGKAGDDWSAYEAWKALWERLTPEQRLEKQHTGGRLEMEIRHLEKKLSIPKEKRVFPN